jgi:diguanylate cyclase (GGDEF)-like protein/PAS domain S-box-containing protein
VEQIIVIPSKKQELTSLDSSLLAIATRATNTCFWNYFIDNGRVEWGDNMLQIYGVARKQRLDTYEKWTKVVHPDDLAHVERALNSSIAAHDNFDTEYRIIRPNGQIRHIQALGVTTYDKGVAQFVNGINLDITDRKRTKETFQESEQKLRLITDNVPAFIAYIDPDLHYLSSNKNYEYSLGLSSEYIFGKHVKDVLGEAVYQSRKEQYTRVLSGESVNSEYLVRFIDNEEHWINVAFIPDISNEGEVKGFVVLGTDITEHRKAEEQVRELAFYDPLTGLPNRRLFMDRLTQAVAGSRRNGSYGALLLVDLDNFKKLNDTLGHAAGDKLLQNIAKNLKGALREGDTISRLGGDEFIIRLSGLPRAEYNAIVIAKKVAEKVRVTISQSGVFDNIVRHSTASIGVLVFRGESDIDDLMKRADFAMYQSKSAGRDTVNFFDPSMETARLKRINVESDLRMAVLEEQLLLHYQVQVNNKGQITGAEALVRWLHPEKSLILPADFIPLAEETGQILAIGQWVLKTACAQLAEWAARPEMDHLTISVNVSVKQFVQDDFVDQVLAVLNDTGANPHQLTLELTESLLAENIDDIVRKMSSLKTKGVRFSLDDFGTGYSSLSYLGHLPIEQLKIDLSFVSNILTDKYSAAITKTILSLGKSLNMKVIAEGVETEPQRECLASLGCHHYQGYLFSRPLPLEEFEEFVRARI